MAKKVQEKKTKQQEKVKRSKSNKSLAKNEVTFRRTGHFWNDLGVIALWRLLAELSSEYKKDEDGNPIAVFKDVECVLSVEQLTLIGKERAVHQILERASKSLLNQVWLPTKSGKMWWSGPSAFLYAGQNNPKFLTPYHKMAEKSQWKNDGHCHVCGRIDLPIRTTGTGYNPLLVSVEKMSGFYSELKGGYKICQACAFAAPFAPSQTWFSYGDGFLSLTLLWPVGIDFLSADQFLRQTSGLRLQGDSTHNYPHAFGYANKTVSCFLDLICSLWEQSRTSISKNVFEMAMSGVQFHALQVSKPNARSNVISIDRYQVFPDPTGVLRLVQACDQGSKQGKLWNVMSAVLNQMYIRRKEGADTRLLEATANEIVARSQVEGTIEARVQKAIDDLQKDTSVAENIFAFRRFMSIYLKEVKDMANDMLPALQSVGETLGQMVKITDDRSILYNLRNARNADDLLEVLSRVLVRHSDKFIAGEVKLWRDSVRDVTEFIDDKNWRRARSLLGIYAGLKFIEMSHKKSSGTPTPTNP